MIIPRRQIFRPLSFRGLWGRAAMSEQTDPEALRALLAGWWAGRAAHRNAGHGGGLRTCFVWTQSGDQSSKGETMDKSRPQGLVGARLLWGRVRRPCKHALALLGVLSFT